MSSSIPQNPSPLKYCPKCCIWKPCEAFNKYARKPDGLQIYCRECQKQTSRQYYNEHREALQQHAREYRASDPERTKRQQYAHNHSVKGQARFVRYRQENPEKVKAATNRWRDEHKEELREQRIAWRKSNPELAKQRDKRNREVRRQQRLKQGRLWRQANLEKAKLLGKQWKQANRSKTTEYEARRRARKNATYVEPIDYDAIIQADNSTCYLCQQQLERDAITFDHVIPLSRGGSHTKANLRVACKSCNSRKGTKLLTELDWISSL